MNTIPTTEKLALALTQAKAPRWMIDKARAGYYDDYKTAIAPPISQLHADCIEAGLTEIAKRVLGDEFTATKEEAEAWAKSPEGREVFRKLINGE